MTLSVLCKRRNIIVGKHIDVIYLFIYLFIKPLYLGMIDT